MKEKTRQEGRALIYVRDLEQTWKLPNKNKAGVKLMDLPCEGRGWELRGLGRE
jgi:hypothetical protein